MLKKNMEPPLSTQNISQHLQYDIILTSASRSVGCLYLSLVDLFDYKIARKGNS